MSKNTKISRKRLDAAVGQSDRLQALSDEASEIRRLHSSGKLTVEEAAKKLEELKYRHYGFWSLLINS